MVTTAAYGPSTTVPLKGVRWQCHGWRPPTAGAMKIEWGVVYNPTIHHVCLLEKNCHPGHRQGHDRRPLPPVPCKLSGGLCSILFILINILFILINLSCPRVLVGLVWLLAVHTCCGCAAANSSVEQNQQQESDESDLVCALGKWFVIVSNDDKMITGGGTHLCRIANFFLNARTHEKREPQKRVARAQKRVVTDLPWVKLFLDTLQE